MCDLIHYVIWIFEETKNTVVQLNADIVSVLFHTERTEKKVFHPMIVNLTNNSGLI